MINAAIAGLGRWGRRLVDSVQENGMPKGNAIVFKRGVSGTYESARAYAQQQHLALGTSYDEILADPIIDAVVLATPHDLHVPQIVAAARAGKHVFVEKPLSLSKVAAETVVAAMQEAKLVLAVGHNRRFLPATRALKSLVADGGLGTLIHLEGNFSGNFGLAYKPGMWRSKETGAAGAMTAMGIHVLDMFIHLAGPIDRVSTSGIRRAVAVDMDDAVSVNLHFRSGASGYLSTLLATPRQWRIQAFGTTAWAHMRDHHLLDICGKDAVPRLTSFEPVDELRLELEAFAAATRGAARYPVSPEEAVHGIAVLEAVLRSAAMGSAVIRV
jgi:predicted dehydrogenase